LAHAFRALGLARGDKVAVMLHNCHQILAVGQAAVKTGVVTVPLNFRLRGREIHYIVDNSDARVLIVAAELLPELAPIVADLGGIVAGGFVMVGDHHGHEPAAPFRDYEQWISAEPPGSRPTSHRPASTPWSTLRARPAGRRRGPTLILALREAE
jgi:long-chain acyl-CoA synthetase